MIARVNESHVGRGFDPYNSADQPHILSAVNARRVGSFMQGDIYAPLYEFESVKTADTDDATIDVAIRRGFKYLEDHPQIAAELFAHSLALKRAMNARGATQFDRDTFLTGPGQNLT